MKKFNVYYTIKKAGQKAITKYWLIDAQNKHIALMLAKDKGFVWTSKGYSFELGKAELSQGFYL